MKDCLNRSVPFSWKALNYSQISYRSNSFHSFCLVNIVEMSLHKKTLNKTSNRLNCVWNQMAFGLLNHVNLSKL